MGGNEFVFFSVFLVLVITILVLDLGVLSRKSHVVQFKEALGWTVVWVSVAIGFYFLLYLKGEWLHGIETHKDLVRVVNKHGHTMLFSGNFETDLAEYRHLLSLEYLTGYLIEYALSVDNIFVMIVIFSTFSVRESYYKQILMWGVLGAVVMRFLFIFLGASLLHHFSWVMYLFGGILLFTGIKMLFTEEKEEVVQASQHPVVKFLRRFFPIFPRYVQGRFFIRKEGKLYITPLFVALIVVEFTDVVFAFDSVPAIFSVTKDPYIVFFSNIFAIMGLRSLFFLLNNIMHLFHYLKFGLGVLMLFIGIKMMFHDWLVRWGFTTEGSLYVILGILGLSILASLIFPKEKVE